MLKIEFEGVDGSGKTTSLRYFIEQAQKRGLNVVETREVGNPHIPACVKLREFVLDPNSSLSGEAMELLFSAMRYENDKWLRNLEVSENPPDLMVSDRGWYSHLAYTDHNVSKDFTDLLYRGVLELETRLPEIVIYFRVNTETALKRRVKRGGAMDVIEMKGVEYQEKVRESFEEYIFEDNNDPSTGTVFFSVDANQDLDNVKSQLNNILEVIIDQYV